MSVRASRRAVPDRQIERRPDSALFSMKRPHESSTLRVASSLVVVLAVPRILAETVDDGAQSSIRVPVIHVLVVAQEVMRNERGTI